MTHLPGHVIKHVLPKDVVHSLGVSAYGGIKISGHS